MSNSKIPKPSRLRGGHFAFFRQNELFRKFTGIFLLDVLAKGSVLLFLPFFLKWMPQSEFGLYSYLVYIATTVAYILGCGMETALSRFYYTHEGAERGAFLFTINSFVAVLFGILTGFFALTGLDKGLMSYIVETPFDYSDTYRLFLWLFIGSLLAYTLLNGYFAISNQIRRFQIVNFIRVAAMGLGALALLYFGRGSIDTALTRLQIESVLSLLIFIPLFIPYLKAFYRRFDRPMLVKSLQIGLPLVASAIVMIFYSLSDKYFLQKYVSLESLAVYNAALFLTMPIGLIQSSFNAFWMPQFFSEKDMQVNLQKTKKWLGLLFGGFMVLLCGVWLVCFIGIKTDLLNQDYSAILWILPCLFMAKMSESLTHLYNNFIVQFEKTNLLLGFTVLISLLSLGFNFILIPTGGLIAAAFVLMAVSLLRLYLYFLVAQKLVAQNQ